MSVPEASKKVPFMYRAQVGGRCQLQYAASSDANAWADEWTAQTFPVAPSFSDGVRVSKPYQFTWRFVTNGGQDDGIVRPVIGARGWPSYPGSSMKGLFRQACSPEQARHYCGDAEEIKPGILRFHGGYPTSTAWTENLVDIVHPQQGWQVKSNRDSHSAFTQVSLHKPEFVFGISSTRGDLETDWETVWQIWERAIAVGMGCRVSAGYGQVAGAKGELLCPPVGLQGQGQAPKLIDDVTGEFRPNVFRAAVRGHVMRIFGGLTTAEQAEQLVSVLFGGIKGSAVVGLVGMAFETEELEIGSYGGGPYAQPTYDVKGTVRWLLTRPINDEKERKSLAFLIESLTRFAMAFGGFGKSWRRADHRLFYPEYYDQGRKPLIGCHWEWYGNHSLVWNNRVRRLAQVAELIETVRGAARDWMQTQGVSAGGEYARAWREAWHPSRVQVWGRVAEDAEDSEAISWLHGSYQRGDRTLGTTEQTIKQSSVTGSLGQIGRLWHRMYPWVNVTPNPDTPKRPNIIHTNKFFELLTLFPDDSVESRRFVEYLNTAQDEFEQLWPAR